GRAAGPPRRILRAGRWVARGHEGRDGKPGSGADGGVMGDTKIEWTDKTWNPVRGCSRVSEGCRNCYAERQAARFSGPGGAYEGLTVLTNEGPRWTGKIKIEEELINAPFHWEKPANVF